jgi:hypothetical protein
MWNQVGGIAAIAEIEWWCKYFSAQLPVLILVRPSGNIRVCTVAGRRDRQSPGGDFDSPK